LWRKANVEYRRSISYDMRKEIRDEYTDIWNEEVQ